VRLDAESQPSRERLLGQLQRGLGAGYLGALEAPVDLVRELVLGCIDDWSYQSDARADFYAQLALAAGADTLVVEAIGASYEPDDGEDDGYRCLALSVLARMAARGDATAREAAVRYMAHGVRWMQLVSEVTDEYERLRNIPSWRSTIEGIGSAMCKRFADPTRLRDALERRSRLPRHAPRPNSLVAKERGADRRRWLQLWPCDVIAVESRTVRAGSRSKGWLGPRSRAPGTG